MDERADSERFICKENSFELKYFFNPFASTQSLATVHVNKSSFALIQLE